MADSDKDEKKSGGSTPATPTEASFSTLVKCDSSFLYYTILHVLIQSCYIMSCLPLCSYKVLVMSPIARLFGLVYWSMGTAWSQTISRYQLEERHWEKLNHLNCYIMLKSGLRTYTNSHFQRRLNSVDQIIVQKLKLDDWTVSLIV